MRQLRELAEREEAQLLCDALFSSGIEVELMENQRGSFTVWVVDEAQLPKAEELTLNWFEGDQREALEDAAKKGRASRELTVRIEERRQRQRQAVVERMAELTRPRPTPLTWGLIALCIAVAIAVYVLTERGGEHTDIIAALTIVDARQPIGVSVISMFGQQFAWLALPVSEPWRLITPVLLHFGIIHILFNLLWLRDLGRVIEARHGTGYLLLFVLVAAALPNIAQYQIAKSPMFGGMSGVVYGLLGLIWLRGKLDPGIGYGLPRSTVQFMLIWFAFGFFPNSGVATWCHVGGLLVGLAWAYIASKWPRVRR